MQNTKDWAQEDHIGNGSMELPAGFGKFWRIWGGPSRSRPESMTFVKMAQEIRMECDIDIPTVDYQVPTVTQVDAGLLQTVKAIITGDAVYVGCMGGMGRTGLFLAIIAKAWGIPDPVAFVRANYYQHAVETRGQKAFVDAYKVPLKVRSYIRLAKWFSALSGEKLLTRDPIPS